jgi:hypothetical protein
LTRNSLYSFNCALALLETLSYQSLKPVIKSGIGSLIALVKSTATNAHISAAVNLSEHKKDLPLNWWFNISKYDLTLSLPLIANSGICS